MSETATGSSTSSAGATSDGHPGPPDGTGVFDADPDEIVDAIERAELPVDLEDSNHRWQDHHLPPLDLPGFGEPEENCGEFIPESMAFCSDCGDTKEVPHVCYRYDCPEHAPHAIRRRAAGSNDAAGLAPQLDALRRYLNAYRDENQYFHHLVVEPPKDYFFESTRPLERGREVVREIMDALGIQGAVKFHPRKGDHEDPDENDIGEWRHRLFDDRDWQDDVKEELTFKPHWHIVGVAPFIDLEDVGTVYEETNWIIHRILAGEETNISIRDDEHMVKALTYALSHAGVYESETDQRRLAAWMKGPDVNRITPERSNAERMKAMVHALSEETLGIPSPSLTCETAVSPAVHLNRETDHLPDVDAGDGPTPRESGLLGVDDAEASAGPSVGSGSVGPSGNPGTRSPRHVEGAASMGSAPSELPGDQDGAASESSFAGPGGSSTSSSSEVSADGQAAAQQCGGHIRHISQAGEYLLDTAWRRQAQFVDDLEVAYRSYIDVLRAKNLESAEGRPTIAEAKPPPDRPPGD
jgi:hypothetical protein